MQPRGRRFWYWLYGSVLVHALAMNAARADSCEQLAQTALPQMTLTGAVSHTEGSFRPVAGQPITGLPPFCRVTALLAPTPDSLIGIEIWLPLSTWNGKLAGVGNRGAGGVIHHELMAPILRRGYAVAATDTGHIAPIHDMSWADGHPEKVRDFAGRAVHEMTLSAKHFIQAFYGRAPRYSYFTGCSTGGRHAIREAQMYPDDYDGVISGAPPQYWTHVFAHQLWISRQVLKDGQNGPSWIPAEKYALVTQSAIAACDAQDGVRDGLLGNPTRCAFSPRRLVCKAGQHPASCLTLPQAEAIEKTYAPLRNPRTQAVIYPGLERSGETHWASPAGTNAGPEPNAITVQFFKYMVFQDPTWDWRSFDFDHGVALAERVDARVGQVNTIDPDLRKFKQRGGKVLQYHGWLDQGMAPRFQIDFYERVVAAVSGRGSNALRDTQDFYRLFMVPGMYHCAGGPGPNAFGGPGQPTSPSMDAEHDLLSALERWVEHGVAPQRLVATKYADDDPSNGVLMQRPLCPYPQEARWNRTTSSRDADSFTCR